MMDSPATARSSPVVSILTPTFNHESFIGPCIESVLGQTFCDWEMIVIDDGSTDRTLEVARGYRDPRIRIIGQPHVGLERLADTYNKGLATARGSLIAILEGDDCWPAGKLAAQVPAFGDPRVVLAYGIARILRPAGKRGGTIPKRSTRWRLARSSLTNDPPGRALLGYLNPRHLMFTYPCTVVIRRAALERIAGFHATPHLPVVDYPTFLRLALEGTFAFREEIVGFWRIHAAGTTINQWQSILSGAGREARDFRRANAERLGLTATELGALDREWRAAEAMLRIRDGRRLLVCERWAEAGSVFDASVRDGSALYRSIALCGSIAARLRVSIEPLYRVSRRPWYRIAEAGDIEVVV